MNPLRNRSFPAICVLVVLLLSVFSKSFAQEVTSSETIATVKKLQEAYTRIPQSSLDVALSIDPLQSPNAIFEGDATFKVNLDKLKNGSVQMSTQVYKDSEIAEFVSTPSAQYDFTNLAKTPGIAITIFKMATIIPDKDPEYFHLDRISSKDYLSTVFKVSSSNLPDVGTDHHRVSLLKKIKIGPIDLSTFKSEFHARDFNLVDYSGDQLSTSEFSKLLDPRIDGHLGCPERINMAYFKEEAKLLGGMMAVYKYYALPMGGTLLVTYKIMGVKVKDLPRVPIYGVPWITLKTANTASEMMEAVSTAKGLRNL